MLHPILNRTRFVWFMPIISTADQLSLYIGALRKNVEARQTVPAMESLKLEDLCQRIQKFLEFLI